MRQEKSFCRICGVLCGTRVTVGDDGRIVEIRGDKEHPHSRGFACIKGVQSADIYYGPQRLTQPLKRQADGSYAAISLEDALDEIADRLGTLMERDGAQSAALFRGTPNNTDAAGYHMLPAWMKAIGSQSFYSTITIDQSAKAVTAERLGAWAGGKHEVQDADVWMLVGINPLVSNWGGFTSIPANPALTLREAKARGMKLIVIDPRRTETANFADIYLQIKPGEDPTLAAGLLNVIIQNKWYDQAFCARYAGGFAALAEAVAPFSLDYVAARAGIPAALIEAAAKTFSRSGARGIVVTGTGPDMAARSNLTEHLYECLNVLCGRFLREGEEAHYQRVLAGRPALYADVVPPARGFETGHLSRVRGVGTLRGEMMSGVMAEEILTPGEGRITSLIVVAGNPAGAFPDQEKTVAALQALDLLVTIDPFFSETARLAHYILPPLLAYERPDIPMAFPQGFVGPFAQYTAAVASPPAGSALIADWRVFWELAKRLGRSLVFDGTALDMDHPPEADQLLTILSRRSAVPLDAVKTFPGGHMFDLPPLIVQPGRLERTGKFDVAPPDITGQLAEVVAESKDRAARGFTHRLISRRMREVMNTTYRDLPSTQQRFKFNPAYLNPADLMELGLTAGDKVEIQSDHSAITGIVEPDATVRRGAISMSHGWGALPFEQQAYETAGSATTRLISVDRDYEHENAMPRMSAIPVNIRPCKPR
jgi:anaerobic selenocysteine-containing dehydrogenase